MNYLKNLLSQNPADANYDTALGQYAAQVQQPAAQSPASRISIPSEKPSIIPGISRQDMLQWGLQMMANGGKQNGNSVLANAGEAGLGVMASNATEADKAQKLQEFQAQQELKALLMEQNTADKAAQREISKQAMLNQMANNQANIDLRRDALAQRAADAAANRELRMSLKGGGDDVDANVKLAKKIKLYDEAGLTDLADEVRGSLSPKVPSGNPYDKIDLVGGKFGTYNPKRAGAKSVEIPGSE